jgi:hypothetical protein
MVVVAKVEVNCTVELAELKTAVLSAFHTPETNMLLVDEAVNVPLMSRSAKDVVAEAPAVP